MRAIRILLLWALIPSSVSGAVPESIVGKWEFDFQRTGTEHIERVLQARTDLKPPEPLEAHRGNSSHHAAGPSIPPTTITFTEDTMISTDVFAGTTTFTYTQVGGNSGILILELTDDDGFRSTANIRFVEGGLAIELPNCREQPEVCEREVQRHRTENLSTITATDPDLGSGAVLGGLESAPPDSSLELKWVYLKPYSDERPSEELSRRELEEMLGNVQSRKVVPSRPRDGSNGSALPR